MNWLNWNPETEEIAEENGVADVIVGYAKTVEEAQQFAEGLEMQIAIPQWAC
uniref:Uncharacterized protein n=1 Tax=viral metagenome TaxID=1070528 RepID=A0A6M3LTB7_9ZZZZ